MKLRNHILLWLIITSLLPLLILSIGSARYNQKVFIESIDKEMLEELDRLSTKLDELFSSQRQLLTNLAHSDPVRKFGAALPRAIKAGGVTAEFSRERRNLEHYFASLQQLIAEDAELRLLDQLGNTVIKASFGQAVQLKLETLLPYAISEKEPPTALRELLTALPIGEISHRPLDLISSADQPSPFADAILPIQMESGDRIYLIFSHLGERLYRLLDRAPRLRDAKLNIIATDLRPKETSKVLYDDTHSINFSTGPISTPSIGEDYLASIDLVLEGVRENEDERIYSTEYAPYPDRLSTWALIARLDNEKLLAQFKPAKWGMLGITAVVLVLGLLIAWLASRHLSRPICRLAENLQAYAQSKESQPDIPALSTEVESLQKAYRDMTESVAKSQQQKKSTERKLQQSAKLASLGEMAAGIGHELNNPLTNIFSLGKLIRKQQKMQGTNVADINSLLEETQRASKIVDGVLNFSRQIKLDIQHIELTDWIGKSIQRAAKTASERNVEITLESINALSFYGDPFQLDQVVVNLLNNAIQASADGASIKVHAFKDDNELVIQVIDHGEGISEEVMTRLFEPFFTTREVGVGNGLGLSISMGIIELHDGSLTLRNNDPNGCTAEIRLPLTT